MGHPELQEHSIFPPSRQRMRRVMKWMGGLLLLATAIVIDSSFSFNMLSSMDFSISTWSNPFSVGTSCQPPGINLFAYHPPRPSNEQIIKASKNLDKYLSNRVSKTDMDSISISIVSPAGPLFESGYGVLKANESDSENMRPVDRDSIYRLASISKMFTVLETLILKQRGVLNWDDAVVKYLPDFSTPSYGWGGYLDGESDTGEKPEITLRQLASHLAGIGRDYPPQDIGEWPVSVIQPTGFAPKHVEHTYEEILKAVSQYPLLNVPYNYPIYSNTGIDLLGLSNVAANKLVSSDPSKEPQTHKELIKRDILDPLGMNSSFFRSPPEDSPLRDRMAVPSNNAEWADISMGNVDDPAGGQYSSLADLGIIMKTFLSPTAKGGVIPANVVREWLRPLHVWGSTQQQVGAPWEIVSLGDWRAYTKSGNLPGYHSEFAIVPDLSVGIIVLMTGTYADSSAILKETAKRFLPVLDKLHQEQISKQYTGTWVSGEDIAEVVLSKGALTIKKLVVRGVDVLQVVQETLGKGVQQRNGVPVALWSTGKTGEFRLAFGRPGLNNVRDIGCFPYWLTFDPARYGRNAPIDLVYWKHGVLTYPSSGVSFARKG